MDGTCNIPDPTTLKGLFQLFSRLHKDENTANNLKVMLEKDTVLKRALKNDSGKSFEDAFEHIHDFNEALVNNPDEYEKYNDVSLKTCPGRSFEFLMKHVSQLYWLLQYLNCHVCNTPEMYGLEDWSEQGTTDKENQLGKWLTDEGSEPEESGNNENEESLNFGVELLRRGFKTDELKEEIKGTDLVSPHLTTLEPALRQLMAAFFLRNPWEPPRVGDKVAFLRAFCRKMDEEDFKEQFGREVKGRYVGVDSDQVIQKLNAVNAHLNELDTKMTTTNEDIYKALSHTNLEAHSGLLPKMLSQLKGELAQMRRYIDGWGTGNGGMDKDEATSRFHYGFKGIVKDKEAEIKTTIDKLTKEDGSLMKLIEVLSAQPQAAEDDPSIEHFPYRHPYITKSSNNIVGGLLGAGAAVGMGGVAYAGNILGFGDLVREAFSGGGARLDANMRG